MDEAINRTNSEYVFALSNEKLYRREGFIERVWRKALKAAGVPYQPPYSMRHTFAALGAHSPHGLAPAGSLDGAWQQTDGI